jgi:SAM-dependent methyltransferase
LNPEEYAKLARVVREQWFYVGKRKIVQHWIQRVASPGPEHLLVDCGAGTGMFAHEVSRRCRVIALDDHEESLALAREKLGAERVLQGSCTNIPLEVGTVDIVTALDVVEHVENESLAMAEFARVLRRGGVLVVTVPALMLLWSDWDVVLHHFRRYTRKSLLAIVPTDKFDVIHVNYINVVALPLVLAIRKMRLLRQRLLRSAGSRSEDEVPLRPLNFLLKWTFVRLACQGWLQFPAGVGLLMVLRKR